MQHSNNLTLLRFTLFALVGACGTVVHYLVLIALVEFGGIEPIVSSSLGAIAGAFVNYALNYRYTFGSNQRHLETIPRFATVATIGFVINGVMMWLFLSFDGLPYLLCQVLATITVLSWNFLMNALWTFRTARPS